MLSPEEAALELFVRRLELRSALTEAEKNAVLSLKGETRVIGAHRDFVNLGQKVDHSCLVVDGLVGRFGLKHDGVRQISFIYLAGDMADLPTVVSPRSGWGMAALTKTTLLRIPHHEFRRIVTAHPGVAEALWRDCVVDGAFLSEWVVNVGRRSAVARVAHLLCEMAIRCEQSGLGDRQSFLFPITQGGLGDATGLTSVHVNRTLRTIREDCGTTFREGRVSIPDWKKLSSAGDFDPTYMLLNDRAPRINDVPG